MNLQGLNPYSNGMKIEHIREPRERRQAVVLILILME